MFGKYNQNNTGKGEIASNTTYILYASFAEDDDLRPADAPTVLAGLLIPVGIEKALQRRLPRRSFLDFDDIETFITRYGLVAFGQVVDFKRTETPRPAALRGLMHGLENTMKAWHRTGFAVNPLGKIVLPLEADAGSLIGVYATVKQDHDRPVRNLGGSLCFEADDGGFLRLARALATFIADAYAEDHGAVLAGQLAIFSDPATGYPHLFHYTRGHETCACPACTARRTPHASIGPRRRLWDEDDHTGALGGLAVAS